MQSTKFDGSIDMNGFAAVLSLAPKNGEANDALVSVKGLGGEWAKKSPVDMENDWDPWGVEEA